MKKTKSNPWMKKTFCFISMAAFALGSFAAPTVFTPTSGTVEKCEYGTSVLENKLSEVEDDSVYMTVDELPTFPGGDMACAEWLRAHLKYPKQCQKERIEGRVIVRFVVEKNGRISNVKAIRSPHPELEKAAVRTVKRMPKWIPGKKAGQIVRCSLNLPIMYKTGELYNNKVTITNRNTDEKK